MLITIASYYHKFPYTHAVTFPCPSLPSMATLQPTLLPADPTDINGLTIGIVVAVIAVIASAVTITVVVIVAILLKKCHWKYTTVAVPTTANQAYSLNIQGMEEGIYNYPEVDVGNTIEAKQNKASRSNTDINTERNQSYGTNVDMIITEGNQAYGTNVDMISTEENQAYATNVTMY